MAKQWGLENRGSRFELHVNTQLNSKDFYFITVRGNNGCLRTRLLRVFYIPAVSTISSLTVFALFFDFFSLDECLSVQLPLSVSHSARIPSFDRFILAFMKFELKWALKNGGEDDKKANNIFSSFTLFRRKTFERVLISVLHLLCSIHSRYIRVYFTDTDKATT